MGDVTELIKTETAETVAARALNHGLKETVVIGWTEDEQLVIESNCGRHMEVYWLLENAKNALLDDCKT